jgi:hypothetical protein
MGPEGGAGGPHARTRARVRVLRTRGEGAPKVPEKSSNSDKI